MGLRLPHYVIVGERAVVALPEKDGGFDVLGYEWATTGFIRDLHAWESLFDPGIDGRVVDPDACRRHTEACKARPAADPKLKRVFNRQENITARRGDDGMLDRAALEAKVAIEYNGDASRATNIVSSNIVYESVGQVYGALPKIVETLKAQHIEVVRGVDRFKAPLIDGWRDILLNLRMPNGHVTEMQLHLKPLLDARRRMSDFYQEQWIINARRLKEDRPFKPAEARRILELLDQQDRMYAKALASS